ncbi:hypothetical protein FSOLCH5_000452 [Fusarium solani]|uniref:Non-reducing end beta-L-arabinofuranosidase n=1 Tax=Fusarium solani TaxID=169388 RepID=A0A9P9RD64_FUSSL|nr:uncharacterized protein B0J15DRAFT_480432 [Fusarium solani]KAH7274672.1 hypothetical protein B0J15DRAFT_480432 [Fusarium solani]KAJ3470377.1 hypothetical protein MRS44_000476 [Fusarium solani]KAJ4224215.1 hypothetical protein NW759_005877 [Fusarium solani]
MSHPQTTFRQTTFKGDSVLSRRRKTVSRTTVHAQLEQLRSTGRYDCFKLKWHPIYADKSMWPVPFHLFWDSDIAKWIEGACYFLADDYDAEIDKTIRELVQMIRGAQQEDGYLNVHYTVVEPDKRWSNLRDMHELYNAGHLIEAAVAHEGYYHNNLLIEPIEKYVAHIRKRFGPGEGQLRGYPGHPEIELALFRLYKATESTDAFELAQYFLTERGNPTGQDGKHYYDWEMEKRGEISWQRPDAYPEHGTLWYCQADSPIVEQKTIEGHAVRANYLLTAVADMLYLSKEDGRPIPNAEGWSEALHRLWDNMADKKMYMTGGVGAIKQWEGFGIDYFLPQGTDEGGCYNETCVSIAVMMLAERILHLDLDAHYADIMELCLYNTVLTAMSLDGKAFTYVNQLASTEADKSVREEWFWCACCPPNLTRLFGSLGGYLWDYGHEADNVFVNVHLYTGAELTFDANGLPVTLQQMSNWPWEGKVDFQLSAPSSLRVVIRLRLPAWSKGVYVLTPSPQPGTVKVEKGYICLDPAYVSENPSFSLQVLGFEPRYLSPHPYTNQRTLTLARGPIVYCVEDADNPWETNHFKDVFLRTDSKVAEKMVTDEKTGEEYVSLQSKCWKQSISTHASLKVDGDSAAPRDLVFVPYYLRANRGGKGQMRVGLMNGGIESGVIFPERL